MNLPIFYTDNKDLSLLQTKWASLLNPVLSNPICESSILKSISLASGTNVISHLQGRPLNGYIVVGMHGAYSQIYDIPSDRPNLFLNLVSSAPTTIDLLVL